jgi:hypothetical protein
VSLAGDLIGLGLDVLREVAGGQTGNLVQDGTTYAFTKGRLVRDDRRPGAGNRDVREGVLELAVAGVAIEPRADAVLTFTGDTTAWTVTEARPIAPGGTTVAWRLTLRDDEQRDAAL